MQIHPIKITQAIFTKRRLLTLALASVGAAAFSFLGIPLPLLFGTMFACLVAALSGIKLQGLGEFSVGTRTILGVAVGASVTPAVIEQLPQMIGSLILVPIYILIIGAIGVPFFRKVCKFDPVTSYYAAMPGGFQDMVIFGQEAGGNVRVLSLIHATRVLIIVTIAPALLSYFYDADLSQPFGKSIGDVPWHELAMMALAAFIGWKGGEKIGLFGASILGPMIVTAIFSMMGLIHMRPPTEAIEFAQFFIGIGIGVHYVGITVKELRYDVLCGVAFVLVLAILAAVFAEIVTLTGLAAPIDAFLAFAPGGQAEMTLIAIITGADLGFVIAHHLSRIVLVITGAPIVARIIRGKMRPPDAEG